MADYDTDNIPVLNDIIDKESSSEKGSSDNDDSKSLEESLHEERNDENLDLFTAEPVELIEVDDNGTTRAIDQTDENIYEEFHDETHSEPPAANDFIEPAVSDHSPESTIDGEHEFQDNPLSQFLAIDDDEVEDVEDADNFDTGNAAAESIETVTDDFEENNSEADDISTADSSIINHAHFDDESDDEDDLEVDTADETTLFTPAEEQPGLIESALIDYKHPDTESAPCAGNETPEEFEITDDTEDSGENRSSDESKQVSSTIQAQQVSLQPMVDDIVKQLLPELEQKLRFLLQQALADRLTEDSIKKED